MVQTVVGGSSVASESWVFSKTSERAALRRVVQGRHSKMRVGAWNLNVLGKEGGRPDFWGRGPSFMCVTF